jgi:hypothetical protein
MEIEEISLDSLKTVREKITRARWPVKYIRNGAMFDGWGFISHTFTSLKPEVDCHFAIHLKREETTDNEDAIKIWSYSLCLISSREFGKLWLVKNAANRNVSYTFSKNILFFSQRKHY